MASSVAAIPHHVPEREIAAIEQQVEDGAAKPKPRVEFEKGDHVRVHRWRVRQLHGCHRRSEPRKAQGSRPGLNLRPSHPSRARLRPSRKDQLSQFGRGGLSPFYNLTQPHNPPLILTKRGLSPPPATARQPRNPARREPLNPSKKGTVPFFGNGQRNWVALFVP